MGDAAIVIPGSRVAWSAVKFAWLVVLLSGCVRPASNAYRIPTPASGAGSGESTSPSPLSGEMPLTEQLGTPALEYTGSPTPDSPHQADTGSGEAAFIHTVVAGETLGILAQRYETTVQELISLNNLANPDVIQVGQQLQIPGRTAELAVGSDFKIIPDSELVYSPAARDFDLRGFLTALDSRLLRYEEEVEGEVMDGAAIIQLVADRHSVNPRLLLAVIENQSGWVTETESGADDFSIGYSGSGTPKLYGQLSWAANLLNLGYYGRAEGGLQRFVIGDDVQLQFAPTINDATAGVQLFFASVKDNSETSWQKAVGPDGFQRTYRTLFGNPFGYAVEPLVPDDLVSPELRLPWSEGESWFFTGGPHGAWNSGSAWGALDFAPPGDQLGCVQTDYFVTSMSDGQVVRSDNGAVVVDLDGDGFAGTGWAVTYMHLEARDRVATGTAVKAGDRLGHPSCEGGFSNGTHVHIVRSYNGRWISADGEIPFNMSGWISQGAGSGYDGYLVRDGVTKEACVCREEINSISH